MCHPLPHDRGLQMHFGGGGCVLESELEQQLHFVFRTLVYDLVHCERCTVNRETRPTRRPRQPGQSGRGASQCVTSWPEGRRYRNRHLGHLDSPRHHLSSVHRIAITTTNNIHNNRRQPTRRVVFLGPESRKYSQSSNVFSTGWLLLTDSTAPSALQYRQIQSWIATLCVPRSTSASVVVIRRRWTCNTAPTESAASGLASPGT